MFQVLEGVVVPVRVAVAVVEAMWQISFSKIVDPFGK
jgi:hypothetical protein